MVIILKRFIIGTLFVLIICTLCSKTFRDIDSTKNVPLATIKEYNYLNSPSLTIDFPYNDDHKMTMSIIQELDEKVKKALVSAVENNEFKNHNKIIYYEMISFLADYYSRNTNEMKILTLIDSLIIDSERIWDRELGGYWDGSPLFPSYMRTAMFTRSLAETILILQKVDDDLIKANWLEILARNGDWLLEDNIAQVKVQENDKKLKQYNNFRKYDGKTYALWKHSASGNQNIAKISALSKTYLVIRDKKYYDEMISEWEYICNNQWIQISETLGYFEEHGNYDVGYTQVSLWLLGDIYFENPESEISDKIINMWNTVLDRMRSEDYLLDTSDSFVVKDKLATLSMPTIYYLGIIEPDLDSKMGNDILQKRYKIELDDGLLDSDNTSNLGLTASDYYLRIGSIKKYINNLYR